MTYEDKEVSVSIDEDGRLLTFEIGPEGISVPLAEFQDMVCGNDKNPAAVIHNIAVGLCTDGFSADDCADIDKLKTALSGKTFKY